MNLCQTPHILYITTNYRRCRSSCLRAGKFLIKARCTREETAEQKVSARQKLSNVTDITNTAFVSKLLERVASTQFMSYLTKHELIAKLQSAYRRLHSTETAMVRVLNGILLRINSRQETVLVLLDMSSAFDAIITRYCCKGLEIAMALAGLLCHGSSPT